MWLQPRRLARTPPAGEARRVSRYGPVTVYSMDDASHPQGDGLWTGGHRPLRLLLAADPGVAAIDVQIEAGPAAVALSVTSPASNQIALAAGERRHVQFAMPAAGWPIDLGLEVRGGVRRAGLADEDLRATPEQLDRDGVHAGFLAPAGLPGQQHIDLGARLRVPPPAAQRVDDHEAGAAELGREAIAAIEQRDRVAQPALADQRGDQVVRLLPRIGAQGLGPGELRAQRRERGARRARWHLVEPRRDALVVNIGDIFQVWSNDRYRAALHRGLANAEHERFRAPFFFNTAYESRYAPLSSVIDERNPPAYRAIVWREFRARRAAGDYADQGEYAQISDYRN